MPIWWLIKKVQKGRGSAFGVLLPLQSTKDHMHTMRIGRHKQRALHACIYWSDLWEHVPTNEQASTIDRHDEKFHNNANAMWDNGNHTATSTTTTFMIKSESVISNCDVDTTQNVDKKKKRKERRRRETGYNQNKTTMQRRISALGQVGAAERQVQDWTILGE